MQDKEWEDVFMDTVALVLRECKINGVEGKLTLNKLNYLVIQNLIIGSEEMGFKLPKRGMVEIDVEKLLLLCRNLSKVIAVLVFASPQLLFSDVEERVRSAN